MHQHPRKKRATQNFNDGVQSSISQGDSLFVWAVHSGNVSAVPAWFFVSGLLGLIGMARRKAA